MVLTETGSGGSTWEAVYNQGYGGTFAVMLIPQVSDSLESMLSTSSLCVWSLL